MKFNLSACALTGGVTDVSRKPLSSRTSVNPSLGVTGECGAASRMSHLSGIKFLRSLVPVSWKPLFYLFCLFYAGLPGSDPHPHLGPKPLVVGIILLTLLPMSGFRRPGSERWSSWPSIKQHTEVSTHTQACTAPPPGATDLTPSDFRGCARSHLLLDVSEPGTRLGSGVGQTGDPPLVFLAWLGDSRAKVNSWSFSCLICQLKMLVLMKPTLCGVHKSNHKTSGLLGPGGIESNPRQPFNSQVKESKRCFPPPAPPVPPADITNR